MAMGLTEKQARVLECIKSRIDATGIAPTYAEIAYFLGLKTRSVVHSHITELEARGAIRRIPGSARAIEVVGHSPAEAIRALNEAAYAAAASASKAGHPAAEALRRIALDIDSIVDAL